MAQKAKKKSKLRHAEYYDMQKTFDSLYADSKSGEVFGHLMDIISAPNNIKLAFRNIKGNDGSHTAAGCRAGQGKPDATLVAGYNKWKDQFERHVKKGEHGITIIAPTPYKKKIEEQKLDPDTKAPILDKDGKIVTEEKEIEIPMFRPVKVFDVSQTDGKPLPELVVSSCAVLFGVPNINSGAGMDTLVGILSASGFGQLNAFCLMVFCLLYIPCAAALATIRKESGSTRWMLLSALFQLVVAWVVTFIVYRIGLFI